jgi:peptidoglycan L-alanyl-D-glutamate endopeptidase CwlK
VIYFEFFLAFSIIYLAYKVLEGSFNMKSKLSKSSLDKLMTCSGVLQTLMLKAINDERCPCDFTIICGYRGEKEQNEAYTKGYSKLKYPNGKHNKYPSQAVDIMPYPINWNYDDDMARIQELSEHIKTIAKENQIVIVWGGDWENFRDYPHWELK